MTHEMIFDVGSRHMNTTNTIMLLNKDTGSEKIA